MRSDTSWPHVVFQQRGLTLVELLVAIGILAFVAVLGWRGLDSITRTRETLNRELEATRGMQLAFAQMQTDCASVVDAALLDGRMPVVLTASRITLARSIKLDDQPTRLQLVTYRIRDGVLSRAESPATRDLRLLDQYWQQAANDAPLQALSLQSGVQKMTLRVWANDGRGWRGWDAPAASALTSRGAMMNPQAGTTSTQTTWTGLEISLSIIGRQASLSKIFMLGAA